MTDPNLPAPTGEPARVAGAINSVVNAVLGVALVLGVTLPIGLGGALNTLVISVAGAAAVIWPLVSANLVRSRVTPLK